MEVEDLLEVEEVHRKYNIRKEVVILLRVKDILPEDLDRRVNQVVKDKLDILDVEDHLDHNFHKDQQAVILDKNLQELDTQVADQVKDQQEQEDLNDQEVHKAIQKVIKVIQMVGLE